MCSLMPCGCGMIWEKAPTSAGVDADYGWYDRGSVVCCNCVSGQFWSSLRESSTRMHPPAWQQAAPHYPRGTAAVPCAVKAAPRAVISSSLSPCMTASCRARRMTAFVVRFVAKRGRGCSNTPNTGDPSRPCVSDTPTRASMSSASFTSPEGEGHGPRFHHWWK